MGKPAEPLICPKAPDLPIAGRDQYHRRSHSFMVNGECAFCGWNIAWAFAKVDAALALVLDPTQPPADLAAASRARAEAQPDA